MTTHYRTGEVRLINTATSSQAVAQKRLSWPTLSTWRWLWRWQAQAAKAGKRLYPTTRYLAQKQGVTERTIYRRLADLKAVGALAVEVVEGVIRFLQVLGPPPEKPSPAPKSSGVMKRRMSEVEARIRQGSLPYRETQGEEYTQELQQQKETPTPGSLSEADPAVVSVLAEVGLPKQDADAIAAEVKREGWGVERVKAAVSAFREAKGVRTPGGWLRVAIRAGRSGSSASSSPVHPSDRDERPVRLYTAPPGFSLGTPTGAPPPRTDSPAKPDGGRADWENVRSKLKLGKGGR